MARHSLDYVSWKQRRAADLRAIYTAATAEAAELALSQFESCTSTRATPLPLLRGQFRSKDQTVHPYPWLGESSHTQVCGQSTRVRAAGSLLSRNGLFLLLR